MWYFGGGGQHSLEGVLVDDELARLEITRGDCDNANLKALWDHHHFSFGSLFCFITLTTLPSFRSSLPQLVS